MPARTQGDDAEGRHARRWASTRRPASEITVRRGPYGLYVQQGEANAEDKKAQAEAHLADRAAWTATS